MTSKKLIGIRFWHTWSLVKKMSLEMWTTVVGLRKAGKGYEVISKKFTSLQLGKHSPKSTTKTHHWVIKLCRRLDATGQVHNRMFWFGFFNPSSGAPAE